MSAPESPAEEERDPESALPYPMNEVRWKVGYDPTQRRPPEPRYRWTRLAGAQALSPRGSVPVYYPTKATVKMADGTKQEIVKHDTVLVSDARSLNSVCRRLLPDHVFTHVTLEILVEGTNDHPDMLVNYTHCIGSKLKTFVLPVKAIRVIKGYASRIHDDSFLST